MNRWLRLYLILMGVVLLLAAAGFFWQVPAVTALWPFPAGRLSNIFLASILAAVAAPVLWIAATGETRALAGGALNLLVGASGIAVLCFQIAGGRSSPALGLGLLAASLVVVSAVVFLISRRHPFHDPLPMPGLVRRSFYLFAALLAVVGALLVLKIPNVFPWPLSGENSAVYGWIFFGNMVYFIYGLLYPTWNNARGQLIAFLAYDLVLIVPFLLHFQTVQPEMLFSLVAYVIALVYSGALAVYYLFVHPATRLHLRRGAAPMPA